DKGRVADDPPTGCPVVHRECNRDLSLTAAPGYTFRVTKERWAQIGITTEFLIVVRTLGEFFRLRHLHGARFSTAVAALYVGGALIAACSCWAGVTIYFFRRYTLSAGIYHQWRRLPSGPWPRYRFTRLCDVNFCCSANKT